MTLEEIVNNLKKTLNDGGSVANVTSELLQVAEKCLEVENNQKKTLEAFQAMVTNLNETRYKTQTLEGMLSSMLRTIADGRPLEASQLRESHHMLTSERVHKIFNNAVAGGVIEPVDKIEENSIVIVQEFDKAGIELHRASEFMLNDGNIEQVFRDLFLNKQIGESVAVIQDGELKASYIITDIFNPKPEVKKEYDAEQTNTSNN